MTRPTSDRVGVSRASFAVWSRPARLAATGGWQAVLALGLALCILVASGEAWAQSTLGQPGSVAVTAAANSLTVTWAAPDSDGGSTITAYDVRHILTSATDRADASWNPHEDAWTTGGGSLQYAITGLRDNTNYDVQVRAVNANGDGPWSTPSKTGATADHGGTTATATSITLGSSADGRIATAADADVFSITVTAGADVWLYTTGDLDTKGTLTDSSDMEVATNEDGMLPPTPRNFSIRAALANAGTYYVKVEAADTTATGSYTLHAATATTPGSTVQTAATVTPGSVATARLSASATDYFTLDLASATDLWVLAVGETNVSGELLDSDQTSIAQNDDSQLTGNESSFSLRASVSAGTYYVKVTGDDDAVAGPYSLYVSSVTGPGSSAVTAAALTLDTPMPGRIDSAGDEDYFRITLESATDLRLEAHSHGASLRLTPTLFDADDNELPIYYINEEGWPQLDEKGLSLWVLERLPAGAYTFRIEADTGETGSYLLHPTSDTDAAAQDDACRALAPSSTISDPLYGCQWHLNNTNQFGMGGGFDINVEEAWRTTLGEGINVLVVDSGFDYLHSDLRGYEYRSDDPNDDTMVHLDLRRAENSLRRDDPLHGTRVAGTIAARDNDIGGRGVAPRATLYAIAVDQWAMREQAPLLVSHMADVTAVVNNSWRLSSVGRMLTAPAGWDAAVEAGIASGYGGKGVFYVWIAHNRHARGSITNLDEKLTHHSSTVVCAVDYDDVRAPYSETGSNLWVCAPSGGNDDDDPGIVTPAFANGYRLDFTGTSASGPIVSGVAALVRAANTALTWRDVKLILAGTARKNDTSNTGWRDGARKYGASSSTDRYSYNREYGFGVVDAGAAVNAALNWSLLPRFRVISADGPEETAIPDSPMTGDRTPASGSVELPPYVGFVEWVEVSIRLTHGYYRDLRFELVSPGGVISVPLPPEDAPNHRSGSRSAVSNATWRLAVAQHLGENAAGTWTLRVTDTAREMTGTLHSWTLTVYGHGHTPDAPGITSSATGANAVTVAWTAPDDIGGSAITRYDARSIRSDAADKSDANWIVLTGIWHSGDLQGRIDGLDDGVTYDIQVRAVNDAGPGRWSETAQGSTAVAPGAPSMRTVAPRPGELNLTWTAPSTNGGVTIESYDVRIILSSASTEEKADDSNWTTHTGVWTSSPGGALNGNVAGLDNGEEYDVQVRAVNAVDPGPWSGIRTGTPALNQDPAFPGSETGARSVDENTPAGQNVGAPITATDVNGDALTYAVSGTEAALFEVVAASGQLRTKAPLDHESDESYSFTMSVTDGKDTNGDADARVDDTIRVTVTVNDVDEAPVVIEVTAVVMPPVFSEGSQTSRSLPENAQPGNDVGDPVSARDPQGGTVTYRLSGANAALFTIDERTGQIGIAEEAAFDFEVQDTLWITVVARNSDGASASIRVVVRITDVRLPGIANDFDINGNERIDLHEAVAAIDSYKAGTLTREAATAIVNLYFAGGSGS